MVRRYATLAALALAVLAVAACGGGGKSTGNGGGEGSGGDPIAAAAEKTSRAGSVQADFVLTGSGIDGRGSGVFDNDEQGSGRLTMAVVSQGQTLTIETVTLGSVLYMRSPVFTQAGLPQGKEWVRLDLGKLAQERGIDLGSLVNSNPNPGGALAYLKGSTGNVEKIGVAKVGGVQTTHYKATIDLERAARSTTGITRASIRRVIGVSGLRVIPVEAWVDGDGYVRKVVYAQHSGKRQSAKITMELHDFGPHVPIASPPSDAVIDFSELLKPQGR